MAQDRFLIFSSRMLTDDANIEGPATSISFGCNGEQHAAYFSTVYLEDGEVAFAKCNGSEVIGKCDDMTCRCKNGGFFIHEIAAAA